MITKARADAAVEWPLRGTVVAKVGKSQKVEPGPVDQGAQGLPKCARARKRQEARAPKEGLVRGPLTASEASQQGVAAGAQPRRGGRLVITCDSVESLLRGGDLSSLRPKVPPQHEWILRAMIGALEKEGPVGAVGPLSRLGPVGDEPFNASYWVRRAGEWRAWSERLTRLGGPMSEGALSEGGPLFEGHQRALRAMLPGVSDQLDLGGALGLVGPFGPLGVLYILGLLGQIGGHGYAQDENGQFVDARGKVERRTDVEHLGDRRSFELVELYSEHFAEHLRGDDSSWMIRGAIDHRDLAKGDLFGFTSGEQQLVTLAVVPDHVEDNFRLSILAEGKPVATTASERLVPFVTFTANQGERVEARVELAGVDPPEARHPVAAFVESALRPTTQLLGRRGEPTQPKPPLVAAADVMQVATQAWLDVGVAWARAVEAMMTSRPSEVVDGRFERQSSALTAATLAPVKAAFDTLSAQLDAVGLTAPETRQPHGYRLVSVGSSKYYNRVKVRGDHQVFLPAPASRCAGTTR